MYEVWTPIQQIDHIVDISDHIKKLYDVTSLDDNYHYEICIFINIGIKEASYRYFINGSEI